MATTVISVNRKAFHDYHIIEKLEAGIVLTGTEIKSVRAGRVNLRESYVSIQRQEAWLLNSHISRYDPGNRFNHEPSRPRKLLLQKDEIRMLKQQMDQKGLTIIPLQIYIKDRYAKVEIALVRGKREYDKREAIARRDVEREVQRDLIRTAVKGR